jgi:hypothetical protein
MTRRILDHDPLTGETVYWDYSASEDRVYVTHEQDVNSVLDQTFAMRNDTDYSRAGIKKDWWHYARIPNAVILDMKLKHGIDLMAPKIDWKAALRIINQHYPALKVTSGTHA